MRIVFILHSLQSGGSEKQMLWMARVLQQAGHNCSVFELKSYSPNKRLNQLIVEAERAGVEIQRASRMVPYFGPIVRAITKLCRDKDTLVWSWGYRADAVVLATRLLNLKGPWLCSLRTVNANTLSSRRWAISLFTYFGAQYVVNTRTATTMLTRLVPATCKTASTLYNFVEGRGDNVVELPMHCPRPFRVVMLGNIDLERKGYQTVIDAAELFCRAKIDVEIHVAGRDDQFGSFVRQIERRRLRQIIKYHGEADEPLEFLRMGHCFLLTSPFEGMPNALLEAASLGLPIITTRVGDLDRIAKHEEEMFFIPTESAKAIKDAVEQMMNNWASAVASGGRAKKWCSETFSSEVVRRDLLAVVERYEGQVKVRI